MTTSLSAQNIVKRYGGVVALSDGNLDVYSGEVLALIGANGSGKSTLTKVINGVVVLDGGQLLLDGKPINFDSPHAAKKMGIATVFQELSLVPKMTVAENIWLAREPLRSGLFIDSKEIKVRTKNLLKLFEGTYRISMSMDDPISSLPPDELQIVEILKAVSIDPNILILDEATASLDNRQVHRLFELVRQWKAEGKAIIFVSHRMEEIMNIADRYTVLRNGKTVDSGDMKDVDEKALVSRMVGKETVYSLSREDRPKEEEPKPARLTVESLQTGVIKGVDLTVHEGELLGLGGLKGQGQRDLLLALFGDIPYEGKIVINDKEVDFSHPNQAIKESIALVPGDRSREGLLSIRSILENLMLPSWTNYGFPLNMRRSIEDGDRVASSLNLVMRSLSDPVNSLSGGNAQKVIIGKWLLKKPKILLLDDPTKGVDVGTKAEFYRLLQQLRSEGTSILFHSSDDEELLGLCDRILVMFEGKIRATLVGASITKANLVAASMGASEGNIA
ncbi:MAG: ABC transporter [Anaerolineae bacterium UTCFX2]|jgi:ribose transport system ATP-binding protein|nr:sugar ABC transporter ATP-binding protein [Anaerolineae bacterium]MCZ7552194.1 sugar ABC transporter ATP-binding protein [Anaerolineales bacterium]OQY90546.1 MAG: ABC transporter [Anaerolineae bacterium UTCFX2]